MTSINLLSFHESTTEVYANAQLSPEDSGFDLYCVKDEIIRPNALNYKIQLGVGVAMVCPEGKRIGYMLVPRSSTCKKGLRQSNSIGIIDSGYNNEICVIVDNVKNNECKIKKGDRLFQLVQFSGLPFGGHEFVETLPESVRGLGGFGSTGTGVIPPEPDQPMSIAEPVVVKSIIKGWPPAVVTPPEPAVVTPPEPAVVTPPEPAVVNAKSRRKT